MKEVTKWWAAADKTGRVFAHPTMPKRNETSGLWTNEKEFYKFLCLNTEASTHGELNLKWEDEPVEVEVTFTLKEKLPTHTDTPLEERKRACIYRHGDECCADPAAEYAYTICDGDCKWIKDWKNENE